MKICGVVVLYNPTKKINDNIVTYIDKIDKLYIIDNSECSNDAIIIENKKIKYIPNFNNIGIAAALNKAARLAYAEKYEWILTMDQDSKFNDKNLDKLIKYVEKCDYSKIGIVSPWHKIKSQPTKPKIKVENMIEVMTSGNLVNLTAWKKVSGWKDWFFIDSVDIEFCMNLNKNNYKVIRLNYVELKHNLGDIVIKKVFNRKFVCSNHNSIRQYYMMRNLFYLRDLYADYYPEYIRYLKRGAIGRIKNIIIWEKDKYKKIRNIIRGYIDYKHNIRGKYEYRN